jgi:4-oxalocrotonate tautomerase
MPIVDITLIEGSTPEQKRALIKEVTDAVERTLNKQRDKIRVILREVPAAHFAVGGEPKG